MPYTSIAGPFGEQLITSRHHLISLSSSSGLSTMRDVPTISGTGTITNNGALHSLQTGATINSQAILETAQLGYAAGTVDLTASIDIVIATPPTGQQNALWGFYDDQNGYGYGIDATSLFTFTRSAGTDTIARRSAWNVDKLDGTGPSGVTLDLTHGNTFQISSFYMGSVNYSIILDNGGAEQTVLVHQVRTAEPIVNSLVCPIRAQVLNAVTASSMVIQVGNRDCSVYRMSAEVPGVRDMSHYQAFNLTTTADTPVASFRLTKTNIPASFTGFEVLMERATLFRLIQNSAVGSATWGIPGANLITETALQVDTVGTPSTTTLTVAQWLAPIGFSTLHLPRPVYIVRNQNYTLLAKAIGAVPITGYANIRWSENW